ncbi:MAG: PilN domain-containing protein [Acidobacteriota bacterium]|nr:PilN domain-containing protein [Acidobacteriota bacterium]
MIRINLLATERRGAKAAAKGFQAGQKITVIGSLIVVLAAAGIGWRYWALGQQQASLERGIDAATREEQRLAAILKEVQEFEARKLRLEARVALIDELRKGQTAPVHMIDQISRSLPEMTWLTGLRQESFNITIQGRCLTLTSLSDFVGNLEATRYFQRPVEILDSAVIAGDGKSPDLIGFTIRGTFQMAGAEPPPPPARKGASRGGKLG